MQPPGLSACAGSPQRQQLCLPATRSACFKSMPTRVPALAAHASPPFSFQNTRGGRSPCFAVLLVPVYSLVSRRLWQLASTSHTALQEHCSIVWPASVQFGLEPLRSTRRSVRQQQYEMDGPEGTADLPGYVLPGVQQRDLIVFAVHSPTRRLSLLTALTSPPGGGNVTESWPGTGSIPAHSPARSRWRPSRFCGERVS